MRGLPVPLDHIERLCDGHGLHEHAEGTRPRPEHGYCTEDVTFCNKVRAAGNQIWIDHDLSREIRHVGSVAFGHEHMEIA